MAIGRKNGWWEHLTNDNILIINHTTRQHRGHRTEKRLMGTPDEWQHPDNQPHNKTVPWPSDGKTADGNSIAVLAVQIQWASPAQRNITCKHNCWLPLDYVCLFLPPLSLASGKKDKMKFQKKSIIGHECAVKINHQLLYQRQVLLVCHWLPFQDKCDFRCIQSHPLVHMRRQGI